MGDVAKDSEHIHVDHFDAKSQKRSQDNTVWIVWL